MPTGVTNGVRVTVTSDFLPEQSSPDACRYAFRYTVTIANECAPRLQLRRRHWITIDGNGDAHEVEGPGVLGEEPVLGPGEAHHYTAGTVLTTPVGVMAGTFEMHGIGGRVFTVCIPQFGLQVPGILQ